MRIQDLDEAVGRIVKGVNTTVDVGPNEIKTQAAKFGNTVDKDGRPPTMSKAVKGSSTNVLYNIGLSEGYKLQLERDRKMLVLNITNTKTGHRTEVRGKLGYESGNYDPDDDLHQLLDTIGKSANISELINGEVVTINPKHPDAEKAKAATDKAYSEARYTAAEWAIIEGGHSLEDLKPAVKKPGRMFEALNDMATVSETIRKIGDNKWRLYSKDGSKNLGTFNSLEAAKKHEREVQYFKHNEDQHPNEKPRGPEAKLTIAMDGLEQSRDELDLYSQREYSGHPAYERYRKRDYDANPARIAIAKIKG